MDPLIKEMFDCLGKGPALYQPSLFWEEQNAKNIAQLEAEGFDNFKRSVARHYFTWVVGRKDPQFRFLLRQTPWSERLSLGLASALSYDPTYDFTRRHQLLQGLFTRMLWRYAGRFDTAGLHGRIEEPTVGHPFKVTMDGRLVSQDLANSLLEFASVREQFKAAGDKRTTICELGAGYGRNAFVFANAFPNSRYIIIDIPPALYVSQRYLEAVLPGRRVFRFRSFERIDDVREELDAANVVFLLPHQAEMLAPKSVDLFVNISSLHEMKRDQIAHYFGVIDRLTRGYFYSKQWLVSENPFDKVQIRPEDYPIPAHWRELYHRTARVQTQFFEAMYAVGMP